MELIGFSMARIVPGGKIFSKDEIPSVAKSVEEFLKDWTGGQSPESNEISGDGRPLLQDRNVNMKDDFKDRSDDHSHLKSERENLIRQGIILPVHKHASVEEVYHTEELPRIREAYDSGDQVVISEALLDPLELKARDLKFHELLAADIYFSFLTRTVVYFVVVSLLLPAIIPIISLLGIGLQAMVQALS